MQTKSGQDKPIHQLTPSDYIVPAGEEGHYHAVIEVKKFNPESGERLSKPRVQKFGSKGFKEIHQNLTKQGFTITILHDPTQYNESVAANKAETEKAAAAAKVAAAAKAKEEERAALKKEILAELIESGALNSSTQAKSSDSKASESKTATNKRPL